MTWWVIGPPCGSGGISGWIPDQVRDDTVGGAGVGRDQGWGLVTRREFAEANPTLLDSTDLAHARSYLASLPRGGWGPVDEASVGDGSAKPLACRLDESAGRPDFLPASPDLMACPAVPTWANSPRARARTWTLEPAGGPCRPGDGRASRAVCADGSTTRPRPRAEPGTGRDSERPW